MGAGKRWRDAITGRFTAARAALSKPDTTVGESRRDPVRDWAREAHAFLQLAEFATPQDQTAATLLLERAPGGLR
jgi:hypothetical protein